MILIWSKEEAKTCEELSAELGITVSKIVRQPRSEFLPELVKIELAETPTAGQLFKLNKRFTGYRRDYTAVPFQEGEEIDLEKEIKKLEKRIAKLEAKVP